MFTYWKFTWWGHDDPDSKAAGKPPRLPGPVDGTRVRYAVWQLEKGEEKGGLHWQGFVALRRNCRMPAAQKSVGLPKGTHFEGVVPEYAEAAREYCMKTKTRVTEGVEEGVPLGPQEWGHWETQQGHRTDLQKAVECKTLKEVKEQHPTAYVKYHRGLEKLMVPKPTFGQKPEVWVLWGEGTGTGKTRSVTSLGAEGLLSYYKKDPGTGWWDGYDGEDLVHIDEVGKGAHEWLTPNVFKQLFDFGPNYVSAKGAQRVPFTSKYVILTSNVDPKQWFPSEKWEVINRRIHKIIYCGSEDNRYEERLGELRARLSPPNEAPDVRLIGDILVDARAILAGIQEAKQMLASPGQVSVGAVPPYPTLRVGGDGSACET